MRSIVSALSPAGFQPFSRLLFDPLSGLTKKPLTAPVAEPLDASELAGEVQTLRATCKLGQSRDLEVFCAPAEKIPKVLFEIGRLRELTFRATGEGTGRSIDLDVYDERYLHLFTWNENHGEVVSAYRLGLCDKLLQNGMEALYTHSLFRFDQAFFSTRNPAVELGRSFVRPGYQREFAPLALLWRGIGAFLAQNPRYRTLFGPVSIANTYSPASRHLMARYLIAHHQAHDLAPWVSPRTPLSRPHRRDRWVENAISKNTTLESLTGMLTQVEMQNATIPVLLRHYLNLGGRVAALNVDPDFSDVLDALMVVDVSKTSPRLLTHYMGRDKAAAYLKHDTDC